MNAEARSPLDLASANTGGIRAIRFARVRCNGCSGTIPVIQLHLVPNADAR
jgi:hypothetical protein